MVNKIQKVIDESNKEFETKFTYDYPHELCGEGCCGYDVDFEAISKHFSETILNILTAIEIEVEEMKTRPYSPKYDDFIFDSALLKVQDLLKSTKENIKK